MFNRHIKTENLFPKIKINPIDEKESLIKEKRLSKSTLFWQARLTLKYNDCQSVVKAP